MTNMNSDQSLAGVSRAIGLRIHCEFTHLEPRYAITLERDDEGDCLHLRLRNDDGINVEVVDHATEPPSLLLEVQEETVQREPVMDLWLPHSARHQHLVYRREGAWVLEKLPTMQTAATVAEARDLLGQRREPQA
jgi:hypothetical protein